MIELITNLVGRSIEFSASSNSVGAPKYTPAHPKLYELAEMMCPTKFVSSYDHAS